MTEMRPLPYNIINNKDWVVSSLLAKQGLKEVEGTPLNNVIEINPDRLNKDQIEGEGEYQYIDSSCINEDGVLLSPKNINGEELPARARLLVKAGDILISTVRPERNLVAVVTNGFEGCIVNTTLAVLRPKEINSEVLYLLLRSTQFKKQITALSQGMTVPTVKLKDLKDLKVPSTCFNEDIENEAKKYFSLWIETNNRIKTTKQVVEEVFLNNHIVNLEEEFEEQSVLYQRYPYKKLKDRLDVGYYMTYTDQKWSVETKLLGDVTSEFRAGAAIPSKEYKNQGVPYVRIKDLTENRISEEELVFIDEVFEDKHYKSRVLKNEILISRVGTIGKVALVHEKYEGSIANQHLTIVKPDSDQVLPQFLLYYFNTSWAENQFESQSGGLAQQFIKLGEIKNIVVPVPTLQLQQKVIDEVNSNLELMDKTSIKEKIQEFSNSLFN